MPKDAHQRLEIARRRQMVADLYLQRFTQVAIAERLGIFQATVCDDLKKIQAEWRNSAIRDFDKSRELELRTFDWLQRESGEAWERSKKPAQSGRHSRGWHFGANPQNAEESKWRSAVPRTDPTMHRRSLRTIGPECTTAA